MDRHPDSAGTGFRAHRSVVRGVGLQASVAGGGAVLAAGSTHRIGEGDPSAGFTLMFTLSSAPAALGGRRWQAAVERGPAAAVAAGVGNAKERWLQPARWVDQG